MVYHGFCNQKLVPDLELIKIRDKFLIIRNIPDLKLKKLFRVCGSLLYEQVLLFLKVCFRNRDRMDPELLTVLNIPLYKLLQASFLQNNIKSNIIFFQLFYTS